MFTQISTKLLLLLAIWAIADTAFAQDITKRTSDAESKPVSVNFEIRGLRASRDKHFVIAWGNNPDVEIENATDQLNKGQTKPDQVAVIDLVNRRVIVQRPLPSGILSATIDDQYVFLIPKPGNVLYRFNRETLLDAKKVDLPEAFTSVYLYSNDAVAISSHKSRILQFVDRQTLILGGFEKRERRDSVVPMPLFYEVGKELLESPSRVVNLSDGKVFKLKSNLGLGSLRGLANIRGSLRSSIRGDAEVLRESFGRIVFLREIFNDSGKRVGKKSKGYFFTSPHHPLAFALRIEKKKLPSREQEFKYYMDIHASTDGTLLKTQLIDTLVGKSGSGSVNWLDGGNRLIGDKQVLWWNKNRIYSIPIDQEVVDSAPLPLHFSNIKLQILEVDKPQTLAFEAKGGKGEIQYRLFGKHENCQIDQSTGKVQIDTPKIWEGYLKRNLSKLAKDLQDSSEVDPNDYTNLTEENFESLIGMACPKDKIPLALPIHIAATDDSGQKDLFQYVAIVLGSKNAVEDLLKEARGTQNKETSKTRAKVQDRGNSDIAAEANEVTKLPKPRKISALLARLSPETQALYTKVEALDSDPKDAQFATLLKPQILAQSGFFDEAIQLAVEHPKKEIQARSLASIAVHAARASNRELAAAIVKRCEEVAPSTEAASAFEKDANVFGRLAAVHFWLGNKNRYEELMEEHQRGAFERILIRELSLQNSFDEAIRILKKRGRSGNKLDTLELARIKYLEKTLDAESVIDAYLQLALTQAKRSAARNKSEPSSKNLAIDSVYWLASHGHTKKLIEDWPQLPEGNNFAVLVLGSVARLLAEGGKEDAIKGAKLLIAMDFQDLAPSVFKAAGMQQEYDQFELKFWQQRISERDVPDATLKRGARALARLGDKANMRIAIEKIKNKQLDSALLLSELGDTEAAIKLSNQIAKQLKSNGHFSDEVHQSSILKIRGYQAKYQFLAGEKERASKLFDECLKDCGKKNSNAFRELISMRLNCGDLDGTARFASQTEQAENIHGDKRAEITFALAKANRIDNALQFFVSANTQESNPNRSRERSESLARSLVGKGLMEGGHYEKAIPYLTPLHLGTNGHEPNPFSIINEASLWEFVNELKPNSIGSKFLSFAAKNFNEAQLTQVMQSTEGRGFQTLARAMRDAERVPELIKLIKSMSQELSPESLDLQTVTQMTFVLRQQNKKVFAFDVAEKYLAAVSKYLSEKKFGKTINGKRLTLSEVELKQFILQWIVQLEEAGAANTQGNQYHPAIEKLCQQEIRNLTLHQVDNFLNPSQANGSMPRIHSASSKQKERQGNIYQTYRRGHLNERN